MNPNINIENEYTVKNTAAIDAKVEWLCDYVMDELRQEGCVATDSMKTAREMLLSTYGDDCGEDEIHEHVIFDETAGLYVDDENTNYSVRVKVTELYVDPGSDFYVYAVDVELC